MHYNEFAKVNDATEAFNFWWELLSNAPASQAMKSRDGDVIDECINAVTVIEDPTRSICNSKIRNMPMRYAIGELLWYLSCNPKLSAIGKFTKAWERMSDDGVNVNSNYGFCMQRKFGFNQLEQVMMQLRDNPNTRQAVIHVKEARNLIDNPTKDLNCTVCLQFFIRDDKLYMTTYMRSNDLWMGFPYDIFQFMSLQVFMAMSLDIDVGTYTHHAGSLHLYYRDYIKGLDNRDKYKIAGA